MFGRYSFQKNHHIDQLVNNELKFLGFRTFTFKFKRFRAVHKSGFVRIINGKLSFSIDYFMIHR